MRVAFRELIQDFYARRTFRPAWDEAKNAADTISGRKRLSVLAAATETFMNSGFLGANMDEIAAASGVSKQTVYKNFGSKEALFIEVVTAMIALVRTQRAYEINSKVVSAADEMMRNATQVR